MTDPGLPPGCWVLTDSRGVPVPGVSVVSVKLHQIREPEKASRLGDIECVLNKVLPDDAGPLVSPWWTCGICGYSKPGGPPSGCFAEANLLPPDLIVDGCPLGKPSL